MTQIEPICTDFFQLKSISICSVSVLVTKISGNSSNPCQPSAKALQRLTIHNHNLTTHSVNIAP